MTQEICLLRDLLEGMARVPGVANREVRGLQVDSRQVCSGDLFLAAPGMVADGRHYIGDAVASGACAVAYENDDGFSLRDTPIPVFGVTDLRQKIGVIANRFYKTPSRHIVIIGVTGTNGKSTCTQLLAQALDQPPKRCAVIGTLGYGFPGELDASQHTTPDAVAVHRLLRNFLDRNASHVAMEVSSHALDQGRVNGVAFNVAVFTNLTRDHLDYHGDMTAYGRTKAALFSMEGLEYAVINSDDQFGKSLLAGISQKIHTMSFGIDSGDVRALDVRPSPDGLVLRISTPTGETELRSPLIGRFNAYNLLAVLSTLLALGLSLDDATARLAKARAPAGRLECFGGGKGQPLVVVDYAHTPDALEKILLALREHTKGKLWCVFGCGGDRDRGKRPQMGEIAERLADDVLLTDDNPRHESGEAIITDIIRGMAAAPQVIHDRHDAIATSISRAADGDIVLIAGKGHEDFQQVGDQRLSYSDRDVVRSLLGVAT